MIHYNLFRFYWEYFNIILAFFLYSLGQNKFVYSNKRLPFNMKPINPIQKYPHIIESYACTLQIFVVIFFFPMNFVTSFGICSTPKLSKYVTFLVFTYKTIQQSDPIDSYSSRFIIYVPSFILDKLFLEETPLNLGSFT